MDKSDRDQFMSKMVSFLFYGWHLDLGPVVKSSIWKLYPEMKIKLHGNSLVPGNWDGTRANVFAQVLINAILDAYLPK